MLPMLRRLVLLLAGLPGPGVMAQQVLEGEVTYMTAGNVYVRFARADGIEIGDTLKVVRNAVAIPCLVVNSRSSSSCVCSRIGDCQVAIGDRAVIELGASLPVPGDRVEAAAGDSLADGPGCRTRGRLSAASYSTMPTDRENDHRIMYRFNMNVERIADRELSVSTYMNYRQLFPAYEQAYPQRTEFFNVYDLAVRYAPDSTFILTVGRRINEDASSLGPIDGLQARKSFGRAFYLGGIIGSRPDFTDFSFDPRLLEYGGYVGAGIKGNALNARTTLGLLQQTNDGAIDRRYVYFQNSTDVGRKIGLFSSFELDLYNALTGAARLTNLYVSCRYRVTRKLDAFASYDSRRRIVYYETFRTEVEKLLEDDEAVQGLRFRLTYRPLKQLSVGAGYAARAEPDGQDRSDNINGHLTINVAPEVMGRWTIQVNRNASNYLQSDMLSVRHYRTLLNKRLNVSLYFRMVRYTYTRGTAEAAPSTRYEQRFYGADLSVPIAHELTFSVLGELSTMGVEQLYRLNLCLTKRFGCRTRSRRGRS